MAATRHTAFRRNRSLTLTYCALLIAAAPLPLAADDTYWQHDPATPGDWFDVANWNPGLPDEDVKAYIDNGGTAEIASGEPRALDLYVGYDAEGHLEQTGGSLERPWSLCLGYNTGSRGTHTMAGGSAAVLHLWVGYYGDGTLMHSAGTISVAEGLSTSAFGGESLYELSGTGVLNTVDAHIGRGTFRQTGGTHTCSHELEIGYESSYELSGTAVLTAAYEAVGRLSSGPGLFRQSGGSHTVGHLHIPPGGRYEFTGGQLHVGRRFQLEGEFALPAGNCDVTLGEGCFTDLRDSTAGFTNPERLGIHCEDNVLLMLPTGFDPYATFRAFAGTPEIHYPGMTLWVPPGCTAQMYEDFEDHVRCEGTLITRKSLKAGLEIRGGTVGDPYYYYAHPDIYIEDDVSGITSGQLWASNHFIGYSGTGRFTQTGGRIECKWQVSLGLEVGAEGTYTLEGGDLTARYCHVGYYGTGLFTHTGGTNTLSHGLSVGAMEGAEGTYALTGGQVSTRNSCIGYPGTGHFIQTGGTHSVQEILSVGPNGTYELGGAGQLAAQEMRIRGGGTFLHTAGTSAVETDLTIGSASSGRGTYSLSGTGQVLAHAIVVGDEVAGLFEQSGGTAATNYVTIAAGSRYALTGGDLHVGRRLDTLGQFDFADSSATLNVRSGSMMDFSGGELVNAQSASISAAANTLVMFPAGFDPSAELGSYASDGVTYLGVGPLVVPAGRGFVGWGDMDVPIQCHGTITSGSTERDEWLELYGPLEVFPGGSVDISYRLHVQDTTSGIRGGQLRVHDVMRIGEDCTATFVQTGGEVELVTDPDYWAAGMLYLGQGTESSGTYELRDGRLSAGSCYVGYGGEGLIRQSGGEAAFAGNLQMARSGGVGTYELSGTGVLASTDVYVGYSGTGSFDQSGDTVHSVAERLHIGYEDGWNQGTGTYYLRAGTLLAPELHVGSTFTASGTMVQTGGTATVGRLFVTPSGRYELSGGVLNLTGPMQVDGEFDFMGSGATVNALPGALLRVTETTFLNRGAATLNVASGSVAMFPAGFDPDATFGTYSGQGVTHFAGTPLVIPAGYDVSASGEFDDRVEAAGTLRAWPGEHLTLNAGVIVSGEGCIDTQSGGSAAVNDAVSGISGGELKVSGLTIGDQTDATFRQTGGTLSSSRTDDGMGIDVGKGTDHSATYEMSGGLITCTDLGISGSDTGRFLQSGGALHIGVAPLGAGIAGLDGKVLTDNAAAKHYHLSINVGTYELNGTGSILAEDIYLARSAPALFRQSGGSSVETGALYVGYDDSGTYELAGGEIHARSLSVGLSVGVFRQTGGTMTLRSLGVGSNRSTSNGTYELSDGTLQTTKTYVSPTGTGLFVHSGGTHTVAEDLMVGHNTGTYELSGSGQLSANREYVGLSGTAIFRQSGGSNTTSYLSIGPGDRYEFTGGTLQIGSGLRVAGTMDFGGQAWTLDQETFILDFAEGDLQNAGGVSVSLGSNALAIVPEGIDPATVFGSYTNAGITHVAGTDLVVPAGQTIGGTGEVHDPVHCAGTIAAGPGNQIDLTRGITVADGALVDLGSGDLNVQDGASASIGAATLKVGTLVVDDWPPGLMNVTGPAEITVSERLALYGEARLTASSDFTIRIVGTGPELIATSLSIGGSDPEDVSGLERAAVIFEGTGDDWVAMEVAGHDYGPVAEGFVGNFVMRSLSIGGATPAYVSLWDQGDNTDGPTPDALYVHDLHITAGSTLVTSRNNIYVDGEFANEGTLDLIQAEFAVLYSGGPSPLDDIIAMLRSGFNREGGGYWDGDGIVSREAAEDPQGLTALGVIDDGEKVIVDYCWAGDANLDGVLDSNDYDAIDTAWVLWTREGRVPEGGFRWAVGDFTYDNMIDSNDYDLIDRAWTLSGGAPLGGNAPVPTPEPASLVLLAAGALVPLARRRRPAHET